MLTIEIDRRNFKQISTFEEKQIKDWKRYPSRPCHDIGRAVEPASLGDVSWPRMLVGVDQWYMGVSWFHQWVISRRGKGLLSTYMITHAQVWCCWGGCHAVTLLQSVSTVRAVCAIFLHTAVPCLSSFPAAWSRAWRLSGPVTPQPVCLLSVSRVIRSQDNVLTLEMEKWFMVHKQWVHVSCQNHVGLSNMTGTLHSKINLNFLYLKLQN